jgi:predicted GNAT family acetyltransferase
MEPEVVENREAERFEVLLDGAVAGFVQYKRRHDVLSLIHTEVQPQFEGRGLASALARGALQVARAEGLGVLPYCPYIRAYLQRHPDDLDLVPAPRRAAFGLPTT